MIVTTDAALLQEMTDVRNWLEGAASLWLSLFSNNTTPTPAMTNPTAFAEGGYPGYARLATLGTWSAPIFETPGVWRVESGPWAFNANLGASPATVYGWFLNRNGVVIRAERFLAPWIIQPGRLGPTLNLQLTQGSQSMVCDCN